jgi:RNA ligase (TIGR02306 family)
MERKLVTVRKIAALNPIDGADAIEVATIDGWKVVTKKGEFKVDDYCVYFEIDSFLPESDLRYAFLMKSTREFEGVRGHKLRTIKLRGQISQGLVLPVSAFPEIEEVLNDAFASKLLDVSDHDFSDLLGIKKYEAPVSASLAGQVRGNFPSFIKKTDQERCQNLKKDIFFKNAGAKYEVSTKLDGSSMTAYHNNGVVGVCSRNLDLKIDDDNKDNSFVRLLVDSGLMVALPKMGNIAIQGELMGPGVQGNRENLKAHKLFVFDIQMIDLGTYCTPFERDVLVKSLYDYGVNPDLVTHVPVLNRYFVLEEHSIYTTDDLLEFAEGPSLVHSIREGVVFKSESGDFSFKAISNVFLAKEKD